MSDALAVARDRERKILEALDRAFRRLGVPPEDLQGDRFIAVVSLPIPTAERDRAIRTGCFPTDDLAHVLSLDDLVTEIREAL